MRPVPRPTTRMATPRNRKRCVRLVIWDSNDRLYGASGADVPGTWRRLTKRPCPTRAFRLRRKLLLEYVLLSLYDTHGPGQRQNRNCQEHEQAQRRRRRFGKNRLEQGRDALVRRHGVGHEGLQVMREREPP